MFDRRNRDTAFVNLVTHHDIDGHEVDHAFTQRIRGQPCFERQQRLKFQACIAGGVPKLFSRLSFKNGPELCAENFLVYLPARASRALLE